MTAKEKHDAAEREFAYQEKDRAALNAAEQLKAPDGTPNVLIWLIDDTGFGQFGGLIDTPTIGGLLRLARYIRDAF